MSCSRYSEWRNPSITLPFKTVIPSWPHFTQKIFRIWFIDHLSKPPTWQTPWRSVGLERVFMETIFYKLYHKNKWMMECNIFLPSSNHWRAASGPPGVHATHVGPLVVLRVVHLHGSQPCVAIVAPHHINLVVKDCYGRPGPCSVHGSDGRPLLRLCVKPNTEQSTKMLGGRKWPWTLSSI